MPPRRRNRARRRPIAPSAQAVEAGAEEAAAEELRLDIHEMFSHYNTFYFNDSLSCCAVSWSSSTRYIGYCDYHSGGCEICLSEPFLKTQSVCDLKNALLHEMIHAFLWIKNNNGDHSDHGSSFQATMNSINSISLMDPQRPAEGYSIMFDHELQEHHDHEARQMNCELDVITSNRNRTLVGDSKNLFPNQSLDSSFTSWYWNSNKELRSGIFISPESPEFNYKKNNSDAEEKCDKTVDMKKRLPSRVGARRQKLHYKGQKATRSEENNCLIKYFKSSGKVAQASLDKSFDRAESLVQNKFGALENIESQMGKIVAKNVPKRQRTSNHRKHVSTPTKRRKQGTSENGCTVMIPSLGYYETEEDDDSEPLLNKRSERRKKKKLLDSLLRQSAQTAATNGKTLALIGVNENGGDQDVDSSVIYMEGCHSMPPSELVKDVEARPPFPIENIAEDPYDEKPPSMKDASLPCHADDENVESEAFEDESSDMRVKNGSRKSMTPNSPDLVYISDD